MVEGPDLSRRVCEGSMNHEHVTYQQPVYSTTTMPPGNYGNHGVMAPAPCTLAHVCVHTSM